MNWWKEMFHICKWETVKRFNCKCYKGNLFGQVVRDLPAEIKFSRCTVCNSVCCTLSDGKDSTSLDAGFQARKIISSLPVEANDPFMKKVAQL